MYKHECPECLTKDCKNINIKNGKCLSFITDNISSASHRLYRGLILPALTEALGESNNQYAHEFILKPEWIYRQTGHYFYGVANFDDIPVKHQSSSRVITDDIRIGGLIKKIISGYVPSMSKFTKKETKDYFTFCDTMLEEIGGSIPISDNQEYKMLRDKVLK